MYEKPWNMKIDENSFELSLRILSNEFVAIKIGSTNFSGKLIAGGILLLFFTLILLEGFGLNELNTMSVETFLKWKILAKTNDAREYNYVLEMCRMVYGFGRPYSFAICICIGCNGSYDWNFWNLDRSRT